VRDATVPRLITIPISHFCEKARWALDRTGLAYREEPHVQRLHRLYVRRAGGGHTAPVLVTKDGVLRESADIVAWADDRVDPADRLIPDEWVARECEPRKRGTHLPRCR
jgi:glutathione S-transferase